MNLEVRELTALRGALVSDEICDALAQLAEQAIGALPLDAAGAAEISAECETQLRLISDAVRSSDDDTAVWALGSFLADRGGDVFAPSAGSLFGEKQFAELALLEGDRPVEEHGAGAHLSADPGQRSRLWIKFFDRSDHVLHMLVRPRVHPGAEPVIALRYCHDNDPEEVAIRFRRSGMVLHKEIEIPVPGGAASFLSLRLLGGLLQIKLNGVPVYCRPARHPVATSFILDVIGIDAGETVLEIPLLAVERIGLARGAGAASRSDELLATGFVAGAQLSGSRSRLHEAAHGLASAELAFSDATLRRYVETLRQGPVVADVLEDLLLARLDDGARRELAAARPAPIIRTRGVSIELSSNPAAKSLSALFRPAEKKRIAVVQDLSFDAFSGDIVGIIGRNGAGKTTFLKSLVGAIPIASGRIDIAEKPILLRPGAGMQPDLTGRQNIYKTGLYMDMTMREIDAMVDDVVRFAELEDHIDRPFRYYSDGMRARLIFSMATAMPRDILLLDELLSAGDMGFQERALERLNQFLSHAKLVFVVQHTFDFVLTRCTKCLLLEKGKPIYFGEPRIATELYRELL